MSGFKYPRGSEWRKWDLHVHTPSSYDYENKSMTNQDIINILTSNNISVVAIADHHVMDVHRINALKKLAKSEITILPGIELRSDLGGSESIHFIGIFSEDSEIEMIWTKLQGKLNLTPCDITNKGSANIYCNLKEASNLIHELGGIVTIHAGSKSNTIENITNSLSYKQAQKRDILDLIDVFEMGQIADITEYKQKVFPNIDKHPPMIICSDNHNMKEYELKSNCWIKADPIYEGLKQIIYEPKERVYIGEEPPCKLDRSKIIKSITVNNSNRWFADNKPLLLNEGLISVIGGKGTGKTAVLDFIAYATKSYRIYKEGDKSFLKKAFKELTGTKIKIEWEDGDPDEKEIGHKLEELQEDGKLRYMPQDFVDQLCSEIGKKELEEQIENVIFQKIPKEDKATYSDFLSYKNNQIKVINDKKKRKAKQIEDINSKIDILRNCISIKNKKIEEIKKAKEEMSRLNNEMKRISDSLKDIEKWQVILKKINTLNGEKSSLEKEISGSNTKSLKIDEIENRLSVFKEDAETFVKEIKVDLELIQISKELIDKVKIVFYPENAEEILRTRKSEIEKEISAKKGELNKVDVNIQNLSRNLKLEKSKQDGIQKINVLTNREKKKLDSLNGEIKEIERAEQSLPDLLGQREILFVSFFELLFEEKEKLKIIYSPLENILKASAEENERFFDFTVQFEFDIRGMTEKGDEFIDHTKDGRFRRKTREALYEELEMLKFMPNLENKDVSGTDKDTVKRFSKNVKDLFLKDEKNKKLTIISQLRQGYTEKNFDDWLHSTNYYSITYSIKFNDIELDNLSPGLKGVALLILYLELDKEDTRPILIDQPEENLDNRSVYKTLMRYFGEAKKRRQIIIVTHNPNLVVNTDSEQIIVANFDKGLEKQCARINYVSGSLENTFKLSKDDYPEEDWNKIPDLQKKGIREHVCEVLEGGREAFEKREKKYGFKTS